MRPLAVKFRQSGGCGRIQIIDWRDNSLGTGAASPEKEDLLFDLFRPTSGGMRKERETLIRLLGFDRVARLARFVRLPHGITSGKNLVVSLTPGR